MLLAAIFGDRPAFEALHRWTARTLKRPHDHLFAWRFRPGATPAVDDPNNATDGDLYIAWALLLAGERWRDPALVAAAAAIAHDILRLLTREFGGRLLLLPGAAGFEDRQRLVLNPSYYVFPAFAALAQALPDPRWQRLARDGLAVLREGRFGAWELPPDWLALRKADGAMAPASGWPPRFSFDAVRVPLLLTWAGHGAEPAVTAALRFWSNPARVPPPAWVDLSTGGLAEYPASEGVRSIAAFAAAGPAMAAPPRILAVDDYYSSALKMLVLAASLTPNSRH
jgi:endoglucanase